MRANRASKFQNRSRKTYKQCAASVQIQLRKEVMKTRTLTLFRPVLHVACH